MAVPIPKSPQNSSLNPHIWGLRLPTSFIPYAPNRWANIIAAVITLAFEINNGTSDLDDTFHRVIEIAALLCIIWSAWRWRNPAPENYSTVQKA
ncbi:MAG: hypothetical protein AAF622_17525 [Cyanobacteria bacterium P01_C01_bin.147]